MRKRVRVWICFVLLAGVLAGCGSGARGNVKNINTADKISVVTTIFPVCDWTRQILGEKAESWNLITLLDNGVDLHSYQPTVDDMIQISDCDLLIYIGGESDQWIKDALSEAVNPRMRVINLMEVLGGAVKEEEITEGMREEAGEAGEDDGEEPEYDEHIWLSLRNAAACCDAIADALCALDPDDAAYFTENRKAYQSGLAELDARYQEAAENASVKTLLFGDRFPFRYLTDDYGLEYYAAFPGCSAETEASFQTIIFLAGKVDELNLPAVLTIDGSDGEIAKTIVENTVAKSARILRLDSLQSVTSRDAADGVTYLGVMEDNLAVLREAVQ